MPARPRQPARPHRAVDSPAVASAAAAARSAAPADPAESGESSESATPLRVRRVPRQQRGQDTVQAVLRAAGEEIERAGLDRLSTKRIAAAARLSVGSLYGYFPNKESIIAALLEAWLARVFEAIDSTHPRQGGTLDIFGYLGQQMDRALAVYDDQPGLGALFGMSMAMPALHEMIRLHEDRVSESLHSALAHYAPQAPEADRRSVAHTIPVLCHGLLAAAALDPRVNRPQLLLDMRACLTALGTRLLLTRE